MNKHIYTHTHTDLVIKTWWHMRRYNHKHHTCFKHQITHSAWCYPPPPPADTHTYAPLPHTHTRMCVCRLRGLCTHITHTYTHLHTTPFTGSLICDCVGLFLLQGLTKLYIFLYKKSLNLSTCEDKHICVWEFHLEGIFYMCVYSLGSTHMCVRIPFRRHILHVCIFFRFNTYVCENSV